MSLSTCIETLQRLKCSGMAVGLQELMTQPECHTITLEEGLSLILSQEEVHRENKKQQRLLKQAKLRFTAACMEDIYYHSRDGLNKQQSRELAQCHWIQQAKNLVLLGATGLGKSYLACAFGQQACRMGYCVKYYRVTRLLESLRIAYADGSYSRLLAQIAKAQCLILDDWGIDKLERAQRNALFEVIEDRHQNASLIITSQLPIEHWHNYIGDDTIADAILDRVLSNVDKINLKGESLRKKRLTLDIDHS